MFFVPRNSARVRGQNGLPTLRPWQQQLPRQPSAPRLSPCTSPELLSRPDSAAERRPRHPKPSALARWPHRPCSFRGWLRLDSTSSAGERMKPLRQHEFGRWEDESVRTARVRLVRGWIRSDSTSSAGERMAPFSQWTSASVWTARVCPCAYGSVRTARVRPVNKWLRLVSTCSVDDRITLLSWSTNEWGGGWLGFDFTERPWGASWCSGALSSTWALINSHFRPVIRELRISAMHERM